MYNKTWFVCLKFDMNFTASILSAIFLLSSLIKAQDIATPFHVNRLLTEDEKKVEAQKKKATGYFISEDEMRGILAARTAAGATAGGFNLPAAGEAAVDPQWIEGANPAAFGQF